ncbi:uncharacterized protein N7482_006954 [Penicillium canariense]|uniref:F-box domain-containing protein n=1 Tax=Penicillium canariense TaxID=189055 RepID=A0A9W9LJF1_9EURO|nr:uncharacterized protein N7482_006954 [Penicillium canariense]KAJ5159950.1 hypothetical protein N7482_006954 [Penicillium canariense]
MVWLPLEILLMITSYIPDPVTLLSLRRVNREWSVPAAWELDRRLLLLDLSQSSQNTMESKRKVARARAMVRGVIVKYPDGEYWRLIKYSQDEQYEQIGEPPLNWIAPTRLTLRNLTITCWGCYIKNIAGAFCHTGFFFPWLRFLELRGCGFTADFQLDWIIRHGRTLRSLKLDDCAIVNRLMLWRFQLPMRLQAADPHSSLRVVQNESGRRIRLYNTRWAQYFDAMKQNMSQLRHFEFGSSRIREPGEEGPPFESERSKGPPFDKAPQFMFGLFQDRYLQADEETECRCCSWVFRTVVQHGPKRQRRLVDDPDRAALRALLQKIGQSVPEDAQSDHAGYVRGLMGLVKAKESGS